MSNRSKELEIELKLLQEQRKTDEKIKRLKSQIRAEKFAQTKGGKAFNTIGDFGLKVGKKILAPPKQVKGKPKKAVPSVKEIMARLPQ